MIAVVAYMITISVRSFGNGIKACLQLYSPPAGIVDFSLIPVAGYIQIRLYV